MSTPLPPPQPGQQNWAVPLNDYINTDAVLPAGQALGLINTHITAVDPHGDQAYARSLVNALTATENKPNGLAVLNSAGKLPASTIPDTALQANFYDVVSDYGVTPNTGADVSAGIQAVLTACAQAGGGEVWIGDGVFCIGSALIIGANTWLHLSPGAVIRRITPVGGTAPAQMLCNTAFTATSTPGGSNILVSGGTWDATGNGSLTSACTPIMFIQTTFCKVDDAGIYSVANSPAVEINGSRFITIRDCDLTGAGIGSQSGLPAVRLNSTSTSTTPAGMASSAYNNATCQNVLVEACVVDGNAYNRVLGSDLFATGYLHNAVTVTSCAIDTGTYTMTPPVDGIHINQLQVFGNQFYGDYTLDLTSTGNVGSNASPNVFVGNSFNGGPNVTGLIAGGWEYATGVAGAVTPETWHSVAIPSGGWSGYARVKLLPLTNFAVFDFNITGDGATGTTFGALPSAEYYPLATRFFTPGVQGDISNSDNWRLYIQPSGQVPTLGGIPSTFNGQINGTFIYPLD